MTKYIVRSGTGYVFNSQTLEVTTDPVEAVRLDIDAAGDVIQRMDAGGFAAVLVEVQIAPFESEVNNGRQITV